MHLMIPKFINKAEDLQTKRKAILDGFLSQALIKTEKARPFIDEAKVFYEALKKVETVEKLLALTKHRNDLAAACGYSDKARNHLTETELNNSIKKVLAKIYKESGTSFRENILFRYLLTKGDTLGGKMRNLTGASAGIKLTEKILEKLIREDVKVERNKKGKVRKVTWKGRILLFDVKPRFIGNSVDVIIIDSGDSNISINNLLKDKNKYLACGELKGGIDPAGADEHWKTANSAFGRIRSVFGRTAPPLFFVGAAIELSMAKEIFKQLKVGKLLYAANLNEENQLNDLVDWLLSL